MITIRAKFQLQKITQVSHNPAAAELTFSPMYDQSIPEDQRFAKATPSGTLTMHVDNPTAVEHFKLGEFYYLDFAQVPKLQAVGT